MRVTAALTVALTVVACSTDDLFDAKGALGIDDGASAGAKESLKVDGTSEQRLELDTGATLTLPKGAVDHNVMIGVERPADSKAVQLVESLKSVKAVASAPYVLTPHGTEFAKDIKLEIPVVNNKDRELVVAWLKDENDREWKYLDTPTVENDVATVTLKHFSVVVLLDRARSGLVFDEPEDAGASVEDSAAEDGGRAQADAGADEPGAGADAGADPTPPAEADAASTSSDASAGTTDAAIRAELDASDPGTTSDAATTLDAGTAQPPDAATGADSDGSITVPVDAGQDLDADTGVDDAQTRDAGTNDAARGPDTEGGTCQPIVCQPNQCGSVPDGCGGEMGCGNCEGFGGVCGLHDAGVCDFPIQ